MKTTADFLDDLKAKHGITSDYALAKLLGMRRQQVSRYRTGTSTFDDETAIKIAELLEVNQGYVMASMRAQLAKEAHVRNAWEKAAKALGGIAAGVIILTNPVLGIDAETAQVLAFVTENAALCILC